MIDFSPLHKTLKEKGMKISDLRDVVLSSKTVTKLNKNDMNKFYLSTVDKLCIYLEVPIEKVVQIIPNESKMD